ncbi:H-NS histone family protein [Caballeronia novacaledonica]|uniref:H-NS family nucleoid-associated regulatory protein n=1 Tax=Caballeronia novacaledonica TaxID=1544861 RepID=UPI001EE3629A|nr:H-NS family nucleoid-associated regulatory protein [Caballeronia novacaledonica]GJH14846.1 H-NS histone family protein [Caballeronia novacaledonica]
MATLKGLQDKIAKLQAQAEAIAKKESSAVFGKIRDLMEKHGLTPEDIAAHFRQPGAGRKSAAAAKSATSGVAKYVDPKTGATWTGHGRAPAWIANAKNRDKFLATGNGTPTAVADKKPKAGNYVRGPQAPKYRDPMSGETWSGRGRAPAWLATAKDRTQFLIEKPEVASANSESAPAKKLTKKTAVKKAAKKTAAKTAAVKNASIAKSAKKAATKTSSTAKKIAPATKKTANKKATVRRAPTTQVAAKKSAVVEAPTPSVELASAVTSE